MLQISRVTSLAFLLAVEACASTAAGPTPSPVSSPPSSLPPAWRGCLSSSTIPHFAGSGLSCADIHNRDKDSRNGVYSIDPDGPEGKSAPFDVYCDMSFAGGGWTLFANHKDGELEKVARELVTPNEHGVMTSEHWVATRGTMAVGMLFVDENGLLSEISAFKLIGANCSPVAKVANLGNFPRGELWHDEASGCDATGMDYSLIMLATKPEYSGSGEAGAAVYQQSAVKFDKWPYAKDFSYDSQNCMLYFLK